MDFDSDNFCRDTDYYWERSSFEMVSFYYPTLRVESFNWNQFTHCEMSNLILPPSCNWFEHNGVVTRAADRLLVTSCFKNIVVYKIPEEKGIPRAIKLIPHIPGKVRGISIYPDHLNREFGHTIAASGDQNTLTLIDIRNGAALAQHKNEKSNLNSICWGTVRDEDVVVGVGEQGLMLLWQPKYLVAKTFILEPKKKLTVVEVLPQLKHQCLVASDRTILLVSLLNGDIISQYKGHDMPIYCIRLYPGKKNPREVNPLPTNTRWKKDDEDCSGALNDVSLDQKNEDEKKTDSSGLFFASSDFGRRILVWDLSVKRFLVGATAPLTGSSARKMGGRDRIQSRNNHIALNWAKDLLYSSTVSGEVVEWDLSVPEPKFRVLYHLHSRVIYNMEVIDNIIMTFSQDRFMQAYDLEKHSTFYTMPTMGACAHSMAFSPHDGNRLAIGMQDESIKLLTFGGKTPMKTHSVYQNIKGKVLSISWHPVQESKLLFGTSEGQVGLADVINNKTITFAYFHQKATYKVEWGPAVSPDTTGMNEEWYAYSFGDRELLARNFSNTMEDPICLDKLLGIEKGVNSNFCLSEFSFSPDRNMLAIGSINGEIKVFDRLTLTCQIIISRICKVIQHLLWKPPISSSEDPYVLGVASGESSVYVFDLKKLIKEKDEKLGAITVTQPSRELCGHAARVIWLSWSVHQDGLLATSSYDHTVQVWDTNSGEPVTNYGGHTHRVFRAEFSPVDADKIVSFAEENCIHEWRPSEQESRTPSESTAFMKEYRKKPKYEYNGGEVEKDPVEKEEKKSKETENPPSSGKAKPTFELTAAQIKKGAKKSSFPLFHNVTSRKKNFHHMCLLSLMEMTQAQQEAKAAQEVALSEEDLDEEETLEEENPAAVVGAAQKEDCLEEHISNALKKYSSLLPSEQSPPETKDIEYFLDFFGSLPQVDKVVHEEIKNHEENENFSRANLMHCWRGSLESHIKWAAKHKQLDPFLVSAAPQISFSLWEYACAAYAEQLVEEEDPVTAATYLISVHKDEEAINVLMKHRYYREALTIAKYRLGFNPEIIQMVLSTWASSAIFEGNFEMASILKFCMGNVVEAARTLAKRTEPRSLIVATQLYLVSQHDALATSTAVLAFKEASNKNEFYKFEPILKQMPHLEWCRCINICNQSIWDHIGLFRKSFSSRAGLSDEEALETENKLIFDANLVSTVRQRWSQAGIATSEYEKFSKEISNGLSSQMSPTSLKNLWFLVSISLSQLLLDGSCEDELNDSWQHHLHSILKYITFWGKNDQTFYLTHLLLSQGISDLSTFGVIKLSSDTKNDVIIRFKYHYILSEMKLILSLLESDEDYLPWKDDVKTELENVNIKNGSAEETATKMAETDSSSQSMAEKSSEKSNSFYLFNYKEDFFNALQTYVDICIENNSTEFNTEDCIKSLTEVISILHGKSKIALQFLTNILSKIGNGT